MTAPTTAHTSPSYPTTTTAMPVSTIRRKILGIGYPKFAVPEFEQLQKAYDIHYFVPTERKQVVAEVKRLCDEHGPFDAGYVVSAGRLCCGISTPIVVG